MHQSVHRGDSASLCTHLVKWSPWQVQPPVSASLCILRFPGLCWRPCDLLFYDWKFVPLNPFTFLAHPPPRCALAPLSLFFVSEPVSVLFWWLVCCFLPVLHVSEVTGHLSLCDSCQVRRVECVWLSALTPCSWFGSVDCVRSLARTCVSWRVQPSLRLWGKSLNCAIVSRLPLPCPGACPSSCGEDHHQPFSAF